MPERARRHTLGAMEIGNRLEAMMDVTLPTRSVTARIRARDSRLVYEAARTLRAMRQRIVNGSDHPCWRNADGAASLGLLPPREQRRRLDAGLSQRP